MQFLRRFTIRKQVAFATLAVLVPFGIAAALSANMTRLEGQAEVREQAGSVAATAAAYFQQYLTGLDSVASALARHPAVMALDHDQCDQLFADVLRGRQLILNIVLSDPDGVIKGSALPARADVDPIVALPYVRAVASTGQPVVSELLTGRMSGKPTVVLAYPVRGPRQNVVGVLGLGLDLLAMQTLFQGIPLPEGSVITLSDANSRILARSREAEKYIGQKIGAQPRPPREVPPTQLVTGIDGVPRFYGNAAVDRGPWLLSVGIPASEVWARLMPLYLRNAFLVIISTAAVVLVALLLSRLLSGAVNRVRYAVERVAGGDLSPPEQIASPNLEIGRLQTAFITMASNLRDARNALGHQIEQERKMRETLESLQRQVVRQERLAAVGVLVSGVAHELNNPLQAILGSAELLERRKDMSPDALEELNFVKTQSNRAKEIIRNLSRFSSQHAGPPAMVDLREVVAEVVQLRRREMDNTGIALEVETASTRKVFATVTELEQVALNFVINAQQAIEADGRPKGRIRIRVYDTGKRVRLDVQDDGPGVAPEDEPKLFQPFFTTKPVGKGTGLGLSVSYGIIDSYGGAIGYVRNDWGGSTFFFELPTTEPRPPSSSSNRQTSRADDRPPVLH
ncbi:MAG: HAMP domain-containing protein [Acidobacteria bacterium]|nr:HAMP domain-containing protein [Acidobacteriota bacterium]